MRRGVLTARNERTREGRLAKPTPTIRPDAGGHRFGPDLQCSECGRGWNDHQHEPAPCEHVRAAVKVLDHANTAPASAEALAALEPSGPPPLETPGRPTLVARSDELDD